MIVGRREMLLGVGCLAAAGAAEAIRPRRKLNLLGDRSIEAIIPDRIGQWTRMASDGLVVPESDDSLAARLYNERVGRIYMHPELGWVMLLIAYGKTQNDSLQLHRPEVCYPAFGFTLSDNHTQQVRLGRDAVLTGRSLVAATRDRRETILYWTRIGEYLPVDGWDQRRAKFYNQIEGVVPDGVLVRVSNLNADLESAISTNVDFARELVMALPADARAALIGTANARALVA